jgi:hypothetical protein
MAVPQLSSSRQTILAIPQGIRWWDPDASCTFIVATPSAEPRLWAEFVDGADRSYHKHGVERALDMPALRDEQNTQLFFAAQAEDGKLVGGSRAKGPLQSDEESHAVVEWAGRPGLRTVRKMLTDRLPFGVMEMKTAWVIDDPSRSRSLSQMLARTPVLAMALLDARFAVATAAAYVLDRWRTSGGVVASRIPATPYPDERYRTKMMWWDRSTFANHADAQQLSKVFTEIATLAGRLDHVGAQAPGTGG